MEETFAWDNPTAVILGRFNPWNEGHQAMFEEALRRGDPDKQPKQHKPTSEARQVCIMVRDAGRLNFRKIQQNIIDNLDPKFRGTYMVIRIPNITNLFYGRQVGFEIERIDLSSELESIIDIKTTKAEKKAKENDFWKDRG